MLHRLCSAIVRDADARDQLAELRVVDLLGVADDLLAGEARRGLRGRARWLRGACGRARAGRRGTSTSGELEPQLVEQPRLAEAIVEAGKDLRPEQIQLVHPRARRDLDDEHALDDAVRPGARADLGSYEVGPLGQQATGADL